MKLGGWTRLWILVSAIWLVIVGAHTAHEMVIVTHTPQLVASEPLPPDNGPTVFYYPKLRALRDGLLVWSLPTIVIYALGKGMRWVWRGFKPK
jgi:hypothetical protein